MCISKGKEYKNGKGGYVKDIVTFIISFELDIYLSSRIASILFLKKLNVKNVTKFEKRNASFDTKLLYSLISCNLGCP